MKYPNEIVGSTSLWDYMVKVMEHIYPASLGIDIILNLIDNENKLIKMHLFKQDRCIFFISLILCYLLILFGNENKINERKEGKLAWCNITIFLITSLRSFVKLKLMILDNILLINKPSLI